MEFFKTILIVNSGLEEYFNPEIFFNNQYRFISLFRLK